MPRDSATRGRSTDRSLGACRRRTPRGYDGSGEALERSRRGRIFRYLRIRCHAAAGGFAVGLPRGSKDKARSAICRRRRPSRPRRRAICQRRARAGARRCRRGKSSASRASPRGRRWAAAARTGAARARGRLSFRGMPTVNADGLRRIPRGSVGDSSTKCVVRSVGVRRRHAPRYFCKKYPRSTNGVARAAR